MEVIKVNDGDCIVLETTKDSLMVHGKDGKIHYRLILKDHKSPKITMEQNEGGGVRVKDDQGNIYLDIKGGDSGDMCFKCPNSPTPKVACDIGYACDGCPYNPELKEYTMRDAYE